MVISGKTINWNFTLLILFLTTSHLSAQIPQPALVLPEGHKDAINDLDVDESGQILFSGSSDGTCKLWDLSTSSEIRSFRSDGDNIYSVALTPDGKLGISAGQSLQIDIWNLQTGEVIQSLAGHVGAIAELKVMKQRPYLASADMNGIIKFWNLETGKCVNTINAHENAINDIIFSKDEQWLISCAGMDFLEPVDNTIRIWDMKSGNQIKTLTGHNGPVNSVDISTDRKLIISGSSDQTVGVWNSETGQEKYFFEFEKPVISVQFTADEKNILVGLLDEVRLVQLQDGAVIRRYQAQEHLANQVILAPDEDFIFAAWDSGSISCWDYQNSGEPVQIGGQFSPFYDIDISSDGQFLATIGINQGVNIWDMRNGQLLKSLHHNEEYLIGNRVRFVFDDQYLITTHSNADSKSPILVWDLSKNKVIQSFTWPGPIINDFAVSNDKQYLAACGESTVLIWDLDSQSLYKSLTGLQTEIMTVDFSPDSRQLLSGSTDSSLILFDLEQNKVEHLKGHQSRVMVARFDETGTRIVAGGGDMSRSELIVWDLSTSSISKRIKTGHSRYINAIDIAPNGEILTGSHDGSIYRTKVSGTSEASLIGKHDEYLTGVKFYPSLQYFISSSGDQRVNIWQRDSTTKNPLFTLLNLEGNEWAVIKDDLRYSCSKSLSRKLRFRIDHQTYPFEQFDIRLNRPDIIADQMPFRDKKMIRAYGRAFRKRLEKMKFKEAALSPTFHVPVVEVKSSHTSARTDKPELNLQITAKDEFEKLHQLNIYINDNPIYGIGGIDLQHLDTQQHNRKETIYLSRGKNKIQISVLNQRTTESLKETIYITYEAAKKKPDLYLIAIGAGEYANQKMNLNYPAKDARMLINQFRQRQDLFDQIYVDSLINENVTLKNILSLRQKLLKTKIDDRVILYVAGHGILDEKLDYYLAGYDTKFNNPTEGGITYDTLEHLFNGIPARQKLMLVDACNSGEIDKENVRSLRANNITNDTLKIRSFEGVTLNARVGLNNSFQLMKELFEDLRRSTGTTVISSASGVEFAIEGIKWQSGVFIYSLLKGLNEQKADLNKNGKIMISELQRFLANEVAAQTKDQQQPTFRMENLSNDWQFW